jgi:hypothetical protein
MALWRIGVATILAGMSACVAAAELDLDAVPADYCLCERMDVLSGDCCCDYEKVEDLNDKVVFPLLHRRLLNGEASTFQNFWVGGIGEDGECDEGRYSPLFPGGVRPQSDYQCMIQTCNIEENPPGDCATLPPPEKTAGPQSCHAAHVFGTTRFDAPPVIDGWDCASAWASKKEYHLPSQMERHTGYEGSHVWNAIHGLASRCATTDDGDTCREWSLLTKVFEGMHLSVTLHIASDYCLDCVPQENGIATEQEASSCSSLQGQACEHFGPHLQKYEASATPDRVASLYLVYTLMLESLERAKGALLNEVESERFTAEEREILELLSEDRSLCKQPFQEWDKTKIRMVRDTFADLCGLLGCTGCYRCQLWGKLQIQGIGLALDILFNDRQHLSHNDKVALLWTFDRFSKSLRIAKRLQMECDVNDGLSPAFCQEGV